jgi:hypothetical protein
MAKLGIFKRNGVGRWATGGVISFLCSRGGKEWECWEAWEGGSVEKERT